MDQYLGAREPGGMKSLQRSRVRVDRARRIGLCVGKLAATQRQVSAHPGRHREQIRGTDPPCFDQRLVTNGHRFLKAIEVHEDADRDGEGRGVVARNEHTPGKGGAGKLQRFLWALALTRSERGVQPEQQSIGGIVPVGSRSDPR